MTPKQIREQANRPWTDWDGGHSGCFMIVGQPTWASRFRRVLLKQFERDLRAREDFYARRHSIPEGE